MINAVIKKHLVAIREGLDKVVAITRGLGESPDQEELECVLQKREAIIKNEIDARAKELSKHVPNWQKYVKADPGLFTVHNDAEKLMHAIVKMDEAISINVKKNMKILETKMSSIYHASRAAFCYTNQSKLRVGRQ
jgi:hypothetical protein